MAMSEIRKKLLAKLRRKFGYRTASDRGQYLLKENATDSLADKDGGLCLYIDKQRREYSLVHNLSFWIERFNPKPVCIRIDTYKDYGIVPCKPEERFQKDGTGYAYVSIEELEMICSIARQMQKEGVL